MTVYGNIIIYNPNTLLVFDGNSILANLSNGASPTDMSGSDVPALIAADLTSVNHVYYNYAVSGRATPTMTTNGVANIDSKYSATTYGNNILIAWEITNDLTQNSADADTAYNNFVTYCNARKAAGFYVIVVTVLPRTASLGSYTVGNFETARLYINNKLLTEYTTYAHSLVDCGSMAGITLLDGVHPDNTGKVVAKTAIEAAISNLVLTGPYSYIAAPPTLTIDDTANTLDATHILTTSEILVSTNGGAFVAYSGQISVGDNDRAAGYYQFKIKAASYRKESPAVNSPAFFSAANTQTANDLTFASRTANITVGTHRFDATAAAQYMLSATTITGDGYYQIDYQNQADWNFVIYFENNSTLRDYSATGANTCDFGLTIQGGGNLRALWPANNALVEDLATPGYKYRLRRVGTTVTIGKALSGTNDWSTIYTFSNTSTGTLYLKGSMINSGDHIINPKSYP